MHSGSKTRRNTIHREATSNPMNQATARRHITRCAEAAQADEEAFFRACFMAVVSMQMMSKVFWRMLPAQYALYRAQGLPALGVPFRFGFKLRALQELLQATPALLELARTSKTGELHDTLCAMHGLRAIKSGLITQLTTGELMCFDSVHCRQHSLDIRAFAVRWNRKDGPAQYRDFVDSIDTAQMWADWTCLTGARDQMWADEISLAHPTFIETGHPQLPNFFGTVT